MTIWYTFVCEYCGYGGLTDDRYSYEGGDQICPKCGYNQFIVEEPDTVGFPDPDEHAVGGASIE